jgi:magnesium and cobalt exporter, CNNM family
MRITLLSTALAIFVLLSGFFSGSETALFSLSSMTMRRYKRGSRVERLIARLLSRPRDLLVTILMMNVLVNILVQNISANIFEQFPGWLLKVGLPLLLTLLFGELIPKSVALPNNQKMAKVVAPPINLFHRILSPLRRLISRITANVSGITFFFLRRTPEISRQELENSLRASQAEGVLLPEEADLLKGYIALQDAVVKELMRPREDLLTYDVGEPLEKLTNLFSHQECSRVPVLEGSLDNIKGVVEASDYFLLRHEIRSSGDLNKILVRPFFAPESMHARALLEKFAQRHESLAVVVDEYGSVSGLITREDLAELVVGEIADRRDEQRLHRRSGDDVVIASGKLELADFNDTFGVNLVSDAGQVTLGGWLTEQLGELPKVGTKLERDGFLFHVLAADPNRVRRIYVRRLGGEK